MKKIKINGQQTNYSYSPDCGVVNTSTNTTLKSYAMNAGAGVYVFDVHVIAKKYSLTVMKLNRLHSQVGNEINYLITSNSDLETEWGKSLQQRRNKALTGSIFYPIVGSLPRELMQWCGFSADLLPCTAGGLTHWIDESSDSPDKTNYKGNRFNLLHNMDITLLERRYRMNEAFTLRDYIK